MANPPLKTGRNWADLDQQRTQFLTNFKEGSNMALKELNDSQDQ